MRQAHLGFRNALTFVSSLKLRTFVAVSVGLAIFFAWAIMNVNAELGMAAKTFGSGANPASALARTGWSYITLSPYYLQPGQSVSVNGDGFMPGENVTVSASFGTSVSVRADASGKFTSPSMTVPYSAIDSKVEMRAVGDQGSVGTATLTVGGFYPQVEPSGYYVIPGGSVRWSGWKFSPGETVGIYRGGSRIGTVAADQSGSWTSGWFAVGYSAGRQTYTFLGETSGVSISRSITVSGAPPYIILNTYYNYPGSNIRVTGRAFGSNEQVEIMFNGAVIGTTTANTAGQFTWSGTVPSTANTGTHAITARGLNTGAGARAMFTSAPLFLKRLGYVFGI